MPPGRDRGLGRAPLRRWRDDGGATNVSASCDPAHDLLDRCWP